MRVGLLSDTHGYLDDEMLRHLEVCEEIWHAGDLGSLEVLNRLSACKPVRVVFGNVDVPEIRSRVPQDLEWSVDAVRIFMTHIGGYPGRYDRRAGGEVTRRRPDLFLCGHSHVARVERDPRLGLLHINPGASGHAGWHTERTMVRLAIRGDKILDVELIRLGPRGRRAATR